MKFSVAVIIAFILSVCVSTQAKAGQYAPQDTMFFILDSERDSSIRDSYIMESEDYFNEWGGVQGYVIASEKGLKEQEARAMCQGGPVLPGVRVYSSVGDFMIDGAKTPYVYIVRSGPPTPKGFECYSQYKLRMYGLRNRKYNLYLDVKRMWGRKNK